LGKGLHRRQSRRGRNYFAEQSWEFTQQSVAYLKTLQVWSGEWTKAQAYFRLNQSSNTMNARHHVKLVAARLLLASIAGALPATHYVDQNSANSTPPFRSWTTAATLLKSAA